MQSLIEEKGFENMIIKYNTDSNLQTLVRGSVNFGHISVATIPSDISVFRENFREIQLPMTSHFLHLQIAHKFRVGTTKPTSFNVTAMCLLPNMGMVFIGRYLLDNMSAFCLTVHDVEGILKYSFPLEKVQNVKDVTSVDDRTVAILNCTSESEIKFIDILEKKCIKILDAKYYARSISRSNDVLYYTSYGYGIDKVNFLNNCVPPFYFSNNMASIYYVSTFGDKICLSDSTQRLTNEVTFTSLAGARTM